MRDERGYDGGNPHGAARRARQGVREMDMTNAADLGAGLGLTGGKVPAEIMAERRADRVAFSSKWNAERAKSFAQRQAEQPDNEDVPGRGWRR